VTLVSIVFVALGFVLLMGVLLMAAALFSPLVITIDSANRQLRVRWLAALEYWRPLPWAEGKAGIGIAGKAIRLPARRGTRKRERKSGIGKTRKNRARVGRFLRSCLGEPSIRLALSRRLGGLWRGMRRSVTLTCREISVSLPDPAWNGMLAGGLAQSSGIRISAMRVNFTGENGVFLEARLYPHRIARALLLFLIGLPYRAIFREWRASSAIARG
jgi:hypothetical protein